jgi:hypothetical protein
MYTGGLFSRGDLGKMVSHRVHLVRYLKDTFRAEFNTNLASLAAFRNNKNLAAGDPDLREIERSAREDFHFNQPSLSTAKTHLLEELIYSLFHIAERKLVEVNRINNFTQAATCSN